MIGKLKLLGSGPLVALALTISISPVRSADYADPGCSLSGSVAAGVLFDWQEQKPDGEDDTLDVNWTTPFGEGAGLVTCGALNIQADIAYHAHSGDFDLDFAEEDESQTNSHIGGALFYRDPASWTAGVQASWISQDFSGIDLGAFRAGLFGELYLDDAFTLGVAVAYYDSEVLFDFLDEDGIEIAVYGRYYMTPDFSLLLRGDILLANVDLEDEEEDAEVDGDLEGFAITGEAEYLVWDQGLSLFAGARYAERDIDIDDTFGPGNDFKLDVDDMQIFGGIKFYFGTDGTLVDRHRNGTVDNTSTFKEKLPNWNPNFFLIP